MNIVIDGEERALQDVLAAVGAQCLDAQDGWTGDMVGVAAKLDLHPADKADKFVRFLYQLGLVRYQSDIDNPPWARQLSDDGFLAVWQPTDRGWFEVLK